MSFTPGNLNKPTPNLPWADKAGKLTKDALTWLSAIAAVAGDWTVKGALSAAKATVTGLLTAGSLLLTTAGVPPFNGKLYAGDTGWIEIGSVGAPAFQNGWVNYGGPSTAAFRRLSNGMVVIKGTIKNGTLTAAAFTLPAGYRPALEIDFANWSQTAASVLQIQANGTVIPSVLGTGANGFSYINCSFYAEA